MTNVAVSKKTHLSIAPPIDVNRGWSHDSRSLHLPGVMAVFEDSVTVTDRQTDRTELRMMEIQGIFANFTVASYISACGMMGGNVWRRSLT